MLYDAAHADQALAVYDEAAAWFGIESRPALPP